MAGEGHAFISYVREDAAFVDRIEASLEAAEIQVWRDVDQLWPGEDWKVQIRKAITDNSLVFLACFSAASAARAKSYQYEELTLAVSEFRLRPPNRAWLIPVLLSDSSACELPEYDLGAGRSLTSLQWVDLSGENWDRGIARLVASVVRMISPSAGPSSSTATALQTIDPAKVVKQLLYDPVRRIELDDFVTEMTKIAVQTLNDPVTFPMNTELPQGSNEHIRFLVNQAESYWTVVEPLATILANGCAWGKTDHEAIWKRLIERIANPPSVEGVRPSLLELRRLPTVYLLYAAAIAGVSRGQYRNLKAVAIDARARREGGNIPIVGAAHVWYPFETFNFTPYVMARMVDGQPTDDAALASLKSGQIGKRHTPMSDYLFVRLRPIFVDLIQDDAEYEQTFDRTEVLLDLLATDASQRPSDAYVSGPWFGRYTWRYVYGAKRLEQRILEEATEAGSSWEPLAGGLFGGDPQRLAKVFEAFNEQVKTVQRF